MEPAILKPVQVLLRDEVAPVLKTLGFRRSAGTFRLVNESGDAAIISVRNYPVGRHDAEFHVSLGFTKAEYFSSPRNRRGVVPDLIDITDTYHYSYTRLRDPADSPMDASDIWGIDLHVRDDVSRFRTVLEMGAEDLLTRMRTWPVEPHDSLSRNPVFRVPVTRGTRSAWSTADGTGSDLSYSKLTTAADTVCVLGEDDRRAARVLYHRSNVRRSGHVMLEVTQSVATALAGERPFGELAAEIPLLPTPPYDLLVLEPVAATDRMWIQSVRGNAVLVINRGRTMPHAFVFLGTLPAHVLERFVPPSSVLQIEVLISDEPWLDTGTLRGKQELVRAGRAWYANVVAIDE